MKYRPISRATNERLKWGETRVGVFWHAARKAQDGAWYEAVCGGFYLDALNTTPTLEAGSRGLICPECAQSVRLEEV